MARELSEAQVRDRLARRGYTPAAIDPAIDRLLSDRAIDDRRAAVAVARTEANVRRHGPHRVLAKLLMMHVDRELANEVVRDLFGSADEEELVTATLERRLRGDLGRLKDAGERRRVHAYLMRQGFSAAAASSAIRAALRQRDVRL